MRALFAAVKTADLSAARAIGAATLVAVTLLAPNSHADEGVRLTVDWSKLAEIIRDGGATLAPELGLRLGSEDTPPASAGGATAPTTEEVRWFGKSPQLGLVARDWGEARVLVGRHLSPTDQIRLSRSSRMFVTRLRLADGRLAPFAHIGFGQWRVDRDLMPALPHDVELAGQLGGGFELAIGRRAKLAMEADYTLLYREQHEPQMVCRPQLWSAFLVAQAQF
jgi:hypothetical protein